MNLSRILFFSLALCSCKTSNSSSLQHSESEPTWHGSFDYLEVSFEDYTAMTIGPFLAQDHELTTYVQSWLNHFDSVLRARFPQDLADVPSPQAAVRRVTEVGAFTASAKRICYELPIRINPDIPISSTTTLEAISINKGALSPTRLFHCERKLVDPTQYEKFAAWYNKRFAPCALSHHAGAEPTDRLVMNGPCRDEDFFPRKALTRGLATDAAPNRILVFAGTFQTLGSEDELAATLAHELAHYYRAHVINQAKYGYCYLITENNHGHRPASDPSLDDLCDKLNPRIDFSPEEAARRRLGYYTFEQEADELALEFLSLVGIEPNVAINAWFNLADGMSHEAATSEIPINDCRQLRERGWKNTLGEEVFVPIGEYRDPHHSWCYRIRNIDREIAAHHYTLQPRTMPQGDWERIQQLARF